MSTIKIIFIPGNGGGKTTDNWFPYIKKNLEELGVEVLAAEFPDSNLARASYWLPFLKDVLKADDRTILIGHSSGAIAAMRFSEKNRILGSVLIAPYYTHLGYENEKLSGYFDAPWDWKAISQNQQWILQFSSTDDPWIPITEARYVHDNLQTEYYEFTNQGHFGGDYLKTEFPELLETLKKELKKSAQTVCISQKSAHMIEELVALTGLNKFELMELALDNLRYKERMKSLNDGYRKLRNDPDAWKEELEDRAELDGTIGDGLEESY